MKKYEERKPIEVTLIDEEGKEHAFTSKILTRKRLKELNSVKDRKEIDPADANQEYMAIIFGGKSEDYDIFSTSLITQVIVDTTKEIYNPPIAQEEPAKS